MRELNCKHCNNTINAADKTCPSCGMPLPSKHISPQRKFIYWFIFVVILSFAMMFLLPFFGSSRFAGH